MSVLRRGEPRTSLRSRPASRAGRGDRDKAGTLTPAETQHMATETDRRSRDALDANIIIANAPDPVFASDLEGRILQANEAVSELIGFRQDELLEQSLSRLISPEETREFMDALDEVVERGVTRNARLNSRSATGEVIPTSLNASALRGPDGKVIGAIGILRDMRELDEARRYAESLIKNAPDPVFVSDLEGKILQANDAVSELLGFREDELVEQSLSRFISPEERREFTAALRDPERALESAQRLRGDHPDDAQRLGAAGPRRQGDRRRRHPARHACLRARRARPPGLAGGAAGEDPRPRKVRGGGRGSRAQDDRLGEGGGVPPPAARTPEDGEEPGVTPPEVADSAGPEPPAETSVLETHARLLERVNQLEPRVRTGEERRWALLHIMGDLNELNKRLAQQRKAMMHILVDYEQDRRRVVRQSERLDNSRRALLHILQDVHRSNERLGDGRKAMIHIMGDLRETTEEVRRREHELRDKQDQLVQADKIATAGELTTRVGHNLNTPLNNIGLFVGNAIDHIELDATDRDR